VKNKSGCAIMLENMVNTKTDLPSKWWKETEQNYMKNE